MTLNGHGGNPKDAVGSKKAPLSTISRRVLHELGLAMLEGECKYWRHNYRASKVRAMVYLDAHDRHISAWIEGQDIDPASGLSHLVKAMACLAIVRDAQLYDSLIDDRPPAQANQNWMAELDAEAARIIGELEKYERGAYTEANRREWPAMNEALGKGPIRRPTVLPPTSPEAEKPVVIPPAPALPEGQSGYVPVAPDRPPGWKKTKSANGASTTSWLNK
jgi:hypothetical protein